MEKKFIKFFNFWAITALWLNQFLVPGIVWAESEMENPGAGEEIVEEVTQEESPTPTETPVSEATPTPRTEGVTEVTPTETPVLTAESVGVTEIKSEVEETAPTPTPEMVEIVVNNLEASVSAETMADSQTGGNVIEEATSALTETGEAVAEAKTENIINENIVVESVEPIGGEIVVVIPKQVINNNTAEVKSETEANTGTGNNEIIKTEVSAEIDSGDAVATANVINVVNSNIVGGKVGIYVNNQFSGVKQDLDLNQMWQDLSEQQAGVGGEQSLSVCNFNQASVENWVTVMANSGMNVIGESSEAVIMSGSATALANVINLINTNIIGNQIFFGIMNINGGLLADLILPAPYWFETGTGGGATVVSQNQSQVENMVSAQANTGGNSLNAESGGLIETGDAMAIAKSISIVDSEVSGGDYFYASINNWGGEEMEVLNWSVPGAIETASGGDFSNWTVSPIGGEGGLSVFNSNQANVYNNIQVSANSGGNSIESSGLGLIKTGPAMAIANLNNLINVNILGNNWFYGVINIIGGWQGRVIFAYPDMEVNLASLKNEVHEGENLAYFVSYKNLGYDTARGAELELILPEGTAYLSDSSGLTPEVGKKNVRWRLGELVRGQGGSFTIEVATGAKEELAWWQRIIKPAIASEIEINAEARAIVRNQRAESNSNNNQAVAVSKILVTQESGETVVNVDQQISEGTDNESSGGAGSESYDNRRAELVITASNNVNEFVYPGDIVTFEIKIENRTAVSAYDTYLRHEIYDEKGGLYRWAEIDLGEIKGNRNGKVSFGIPTSTKTEPGKYFSKTIVYGLDKHGQELESNQSETEFAIKSRFGKVMAATDGLDQGENIQGEVAGDKTEIMEIVESEKEDWFLYVALFVQSSMWIYHQLNKWRSGGKVNIFEVFYLLFVIVCFTLSVLMLFSITALAQISPF